MKNTKKNNLGFTLIELLVVSTIIVLLTAIGAATYTSLGKQSRDSKRKGDLEQIRAALEMYRTNDTNSSYPPTAIVDYLCSSYPKAISGAGNTYLATIPIDPKCPTYSYFYQALPVGCTGAVGSICLDYNLGAYLEITSTCGVTVSCVIGNCNYCLGAYGKK